MIGGNNILWATCDDKMQVWIDGKLQNVAGTPEAWGTLVKMRSPVDAKLAAFRCQSQKPPYRGLLVSMSNGFVSQGDEAWLCTETSEIGWNKPDTEINENLWKTPNSYYRGCNPVTNLESEHCESPWDHVDEIEDTANWIWLESFETSKEGPHTIYCRWNLTLL